MIARDISNKNFQANVAKWKVYYCNKCKNGIFYNKKPKKLFICNKCCHTKTDNYFSLTDPGSVPAHLPVLTFIEEQLISLVHINQYVYFRKSNTLATKGKF